MKTLTLAKFVLFTFGVIFFTSEALAYPLPNHNTPGNNLVFQKFDIRSGRSTELRIVNASTLPATVKLDYVCPGIKHVNEFCATLDRVVTFTPYQTQVIDVASHNPPCAQGFVFAGPIVSQADKTPTLHPFLYGSYHIYDGRRHEANNALVFEAVTNGNTNRVGTALLATDFQATVPGDTAGSRLVLLDLNVIPGMQNPPAVAFVDFWNAAEEPFSSSLEFICWTEKQLDEIDDNFRAENLGTRYGSMLIEPRPTCPVPGTCPPTPYHLPYMYGSIEQFGEGIRATRTLHNEYLEIE